MAVELESVVQLYDEGVNYGKIGVSKRIDNYTFAEISDYLYAGVSTDQFKNYKAPLTGIYRRDCSAPLTINVNDRTGVVTALEGEGDDTGDVYCKVIWCYTGTYGVNLLTQQTLSITDTGVYIITNMDASKIVIQMTTTKAYTWGEDWTTRQAASFSDDGKAMDFTPNCYYQDNGAVNFNPSGTDTHRHIINNIAPFLIVPAGDSFILLNAVFARTIGGGYGPVVNEPAGNQYNYLTAINENTFSFAPVCTPTPPLSQNWYAYGISLFGINSAATNYSLYFLFNESNRYYWWRYVPNTHDKLLLYMIRSGVFIYTDKLYKPIISGGYISGYTDNAAAESDIDNYTYSGGNKHDVPPTPPGPTPPGPGYDDDPWNGATFAGTGVGGAGAFAKVYYMTATELANLRSWMNSINVPEGFDPMAQVIGLSQVPVALSGSGPENVVFVNSSAVYDPGVTTRAVDTGVATQQAMGTPISYYLGSVDIARRMQQRGEPYLDYDCQIELYLPLIGMFSLDTQAVMGRTISAYAVLDPVSGTLAAYAYATKDGQNLPVAYGSSSIGVDLPISAQQLSVSRAALKQANAQLGASLLSGALTMLAAASSGKASGTGAKTSTGSSGLSAAGIREAGSDYMKASQVGNVFGDFMNWGRTIRQLSYGNNTAIAGSFGGSTAQWSYPFTPYVKIIRPRYEKPSNYAHSQGIPCVQTKTIGSCTGFVQCIGADVSGISGATDLELRAIQAALSNGIYAGGGS